MSLVYSLVLYLGYKAVLGILIQKEQRSQA